MAGKGDKWRKTVNFKKYWSNWEFIKKEDTKKQPKVLKGGKIRYTY